MVGMDMIPWFGQCRATDEGFELRRDTRDSGSLRVPWWVEGYGEIMLSTSTLIERPEPYLLEVELARGKVNQLRNQLFDWRNTGYEVGQDILDKVAAAVHALAEAATNQEEVHTAAGQSQRAIELALDAGHALAGSVAAQSLVARQKPTGRLEVIVAANLGSVPIDPAIEAKIHASFTTAVVPMNWGQVAAREGELDWSLTDRQLRWCDDAGWPAIAGPLVPLATGTLPDWLHLWAGDRNQLERLTAEWVRTAVERYQGRVQLWQAVAGPRRAQGLRLSEDESLHLAAISIEALRKIDRRTPVSIVVDAPWAEFMQSEELELSPWHFVDALIRAGLGLSVLTLEMWLGYEPNGCIRRDALDLSRQLDLWSQLGLPLLVELAIPSGDAPATAGCPGVCGDGWTPEAQSKILEQYLPLILSKPYVRGAIWRQVQDTPGAQLPKAGLFDERGQAKPAMTVWQNWRDAI